jgi:hypothetical protein
MSNGKILLAMQVLHSNNLISQLPQRRNDQDGKEEASKTSHPESGYIRHKSVRLEWSRSGMTETPNL